MNKLSLADQVQKKIAQIHALNTSLKAIMPEKGLEQRLEQSANLLESNYLQGKTSSPLYGSLLGVKDTFFTSELPTRAGSWLPADTFSGSPSIAVAQLTNAGALLLGKTACSEFSYQNKPGTLNPIAWDRSPGGSSSGSAASVAAGMCDIALGSQSRGGIMIPAAFCGVFGFKPSSGRISNLGMLSFTPTLEQSGLFASSLDLLIRAATILLNKSTKNQDECDSLLIGIPSQAYLAQADADILSFFDLQMKQLTERGYQIVQLDMFDDYQQLNHFHHDLFAAEFTLQHITYYQKYPQLYSLSARQLFETGLTVKPESIYEAREMQQTLREEMESDMCAKGVSILLSPSTACLPPLSGNAIIPTFLNLPFSFLGFPCLSIPLTGHPSGLPFGLQISSLWGYDEYLLQSAATIVSTLECKQL